MSLITLKPLKKTKLNIKLKWYMFLFHKLLFVLLLILCSAKKNIPEIEVTAHHLVTTFSDGGGALSVAGLWQAKSVDQIMGESPHKLFV